jgi:hypothetical protein
LNIGRYRTFLPVGYTWVSIIDTSDFGGSAMRRYSMCLAVLMGALLSTSLAIAQVDCTLLNGCLVREQPPSDRIVPVWWADLANKATEGICEGDWVVTYDTNTPSWIEADPSRYRYYGADWTRIAGWLWVEPEADARLDNQLPGITLCLSRLYTEDDVRYGSYLWLTE